MDSTKFVLKFAAFLLLAGDGCLSVYVGLHMVNDVVANICSRCIIAWLNVSKFGYKL